MSSKKGNLLFISLLILIWGVALFLTNPSGNFPLNDDWMYSRQVYQLYTNHTYHIVNEYSPVLVSQVLWGTLFCLPYGFSFIALRISGILLGLVGSIVFYLLINRLLNNKLLSFLCSLLLVCNPFFFCLSNSFMTDVPFLTFSLISLILFIKALEKPGTNILLLASFAAIMATFIRQFGVIIPIAYGMVILLQRKQPLREKILNILPAIIIGTLLYVGLQILKSIGFGAYDRTEIGTFITDPLLFLQIKIRTGLALYYSGFFLLPLLILLKNPLKNTSQRQKIFIGIFSALFIIPLYSAWELLPLGNYLNTGGIGPITLKFEQEHLPDFPQPIIIALRTIALAGALLLLVHTGKAFSEMIEAIRKKTITESLRRKIFVTLCLMGYTFLVSVPYFFFDRYTLYFLPFFLIIILPGQIELVNLKLRRVAVSATVLFVFMAYSVIGTHDYFSWQRARWDALHYLTEEKKISAHDIDGGYEFNGWYIGVKYPEKPGRSWWFVDKDDYTVTQNMQDGYTAITFGYDKYYPFGSNEIYILYKDK